MCAGEEECPIVLQHVFIGAVLTFKLGLPCCSWATCQVLDDRATTTASNSTSMVDHFVAYVRGAAMLEGVAAPVG
jgi:hypothetical protein